MALWARPHFPSPSLWLAKGHGKDMAPAAYPQSWTPLVIKEAGDDFNHHQGESRTELLTQIHTCTQCAQCNTHINTTIHMYTEAIHVHNHTCTQITHMPTHAKTVIIENTRQMIIHSYTCTENTRTHKTHVHITTHIHITTHAHRLHQSTHMHTHVHTITCVHTYTYRCMHKHTHMHT